ncbi:MAG: hypothetical protein JSV50_17555 [Desulfobacteraceae bacterium]|nr:MAG: hypothetical protein JSV50_17555 [Desulfobacteraceae bacterium]
MIEKKDLVAKAKTLGAYFLKELQAIQSPQISGVRGLGLMITASC